MSDSAGKHLSEVIDFETDILPYRMIQIIAGVGAGKNYWVNKVVANQKHQIDRYSYRKSNVLLITSRAATANAQAENLGADRWVDLEELFRSNKKGGIGEQRYKDYKCIVTNSGIESFLKNTYSKSDEGTHIWNCFDYIVLDEAHSLTADATFTNAPFYVERFILCPLGKTPDCKVILMTGTADSILWFFSSIKLPHEEINLLDKMEECTHVSPDIVTPTTSDAAFMNLLTHYRKGNRIIYFARHITTIKNLVKKLTKQGVPESDIGIAYSDSHRDKDFSENLVTQKEEIRKNLIEKEKLPDDVKIFLTTSQNKEGININNEDIKVMFAESTLKSALIQMAGRVRKGLSILYVIYNTGREDFEKNEFEAVRDCYCLQRIRDAATKYTQCAKKKPAYEHKYSPQHIVDNIEATFPNIRYDLLYRRFQMYTGRIKGNQDEASNYYELTDYIFNWDKAVYRDTKHDIMSEEYGNRTGKDLFQEWFPYSIISDPLEEIPIDELTKIIKDEIIKLLKRENSFNCSISREKRDEMAEKIRIDILYKKNCSLLKINPQFKQVGRLLKKFGLTCRKLNNHGDSYIIESDEDRDKTDVPKEI